MKTVLAASFTVKTPCVLSTVYLCVSHDAKKVVICAQIIKLFVSVTKTQCAHR